MIRANYQPEEGGPCAHHDCGGHLVLPPTKNCSCFQSAPCSACMDSVFTCDVCGWAAPGPSEAGDAEWAEIERQAAKFKIFGLKGTLANPAGDLDVTWAWFCIGPDGLAYITMTWRFAVDFALRHIVHQQISNRGKD